MSARRRIGASALELSALGLGCAGLAGLYHPVSEAQALGALDAAWEAGLRYFDTAPFYGFGRSEHLLGRALRAWQEQGRPADWVISSKVGRRLRRRRGTDPVSRDWANPLPFTPVYDYSYDGVMRSYEDSLQRLGLARIDILLVHDIGAYTHGGEHQHYWRQLSAGGGFRALAELRAAGEVAAIGLGVNEVAVVEQALQEFDLDCCLLAGRYTLLEQLALEQLLPLCAARGVSLLLGGVFNSGILAGGAPTYNYGAAPPDVLERVRLLNEVSQRHGVALAAAALQFPAAHPQVASVLIGGRSAAEVQQCVAHFAAPIAPAYWDELRALGLLAAQAPVPAGEA